MAELFQKALINVQHEESSTRPNKVMVDVCENLLKHGWFAAPGEKRDIFSACELPLTQKKSLVKLDNDVIGNCLRKQPLGKIKELNVDIEKLLNMLAPGKEVVKEGKSRGTMDKPMLRESLLSHGWHAVSSNTQLSKPTTDTVEHDKPLISTDSKSKKRSKNLKTGKPAVALEKYILNRTGKKKRQNGEKSFKKTKRHEPVINNLIQQGWSVINQSRYQITVVKIPESQTKLKTTSTSEMNRNKVDAPVVFGVSHQKKNLLRRFVRRSRKVIGRFFTCGKQED